MSETSSVPEPDPAPEIQSPTAASAGVSFAKTAPPVPALESINCPACGLKIAVKKEAGNTEISCNSCQKIVDVRRFPKFAAKKNDADSAKTADRISQEGDATCTFYPELKAEHICAECGCFMSEKASITWNSKTLCLPCLHTLREKKGKDEFRAGAKLYDNIALALTAPFLASVFLWPVTMVTAPIALIMLIRHRKASRGIVPRSSFRWWAALVLSSFLTCVLLYFIITWIQVMVDDITS